MNTIQEKILKKIQAGELRMEPRWHFVLRAMLYGVATVIVALISVYLLSFVFFILYRSGLLFAPAFGTKGLILFVVASPWILISFVIIFLITLAVLVRHFAFNYRKPLVYSLLGSVLFVLVVSTAIHMSMMHERVRSFVEGRDIPGMSLMYHDHRPDGVVFGLVASTTDTGFLLFDDQTGDIVSVATSTKTRLPQEPIMAGERVMVFGEMQTGVLQAVGVRPIRENDDLPPERRGLHLR